MGHDHNHGHDHTHGANKKALLISFFITSGYMVLEAIGGFLTNSLALLSDAGHMLSDSVSLGVGVLAFVLGEKVANYSKTYGYKRFEILAALFNGVTLSLIAVYIFYEAYQRFQNPPEVASTGMLVIGTIGLIVNIFVAWILMRGDTEENLNLRAAFLHVIGDLLGSVGAIIAALLILFFNWGWADPLASVIVAVLVLISGIRVTKDASHILMEGTPKNVELSDIIEVIENIPGVHSIHDLHVWSITSGQNALSCHAVVNDNLSIHDSQKLLRTIEDQLQHKGIGHVTVQMENEEHPHDDSLMCKESTHSPVDHHDEN
ncbi:cation diffusion facilitator family transporter [Sediminibacillus dalangtanensis]|uniref:Cation diffusion facilitator family transporter n=1 Tax=Sediminibacillus dalangtanensis TaxID=2729421 RepID=A0ABX7VND9_9BACI|nr:cation diffusion facilitator family transporter [Sediminibacillus dalangtanensis]QTM97953.1 cation diffusion facilitator family transporter [Sediminibacillus dalangtanensis]